MSTTFAVTLLNGEERAIARRVGRGYPLGAEVFFLDDLYKSLTNDIEVSPIDNTAQGIFTIGDIKNENIMFERRKELFDAIGYMGEDELIKVLGAVRNKLTEIVGNKEGDSFQIDFPCTKFPDGEI